MNFMKQLVVSASLVATLGYFAFSASYAQEAGAPAEATKMEAPAAAPGAPPAEAKKEDPGAAPAQFTQGLMTQIGDAKVAMDTM